MISDAKSRDKLIFKTSKGVRKVKKSQLRWKFGRKILPSNNFNLEVHDNHVSVVGDGHGHGVGMCQFGAMELAKRGFNYKEILAYYFPKLKIKKIY